MRAIAMQGKKRRIRGEASRGGAGDQGVRFESHRASKGPNIVQGRGADYSAFPYNTVENLPILPPQELA